MTTRSNEQGTFSFNLDRAGRYLLQANHGDYYPIEDKTLDLITGVNLQHRAHFPGGVPNHGRCLS